MEESKPSAEPDSREWADFTTWNTEDFYTYLKEKLDWEDCDSDAEKMRDLKLKIEIGSADGKVLIEVNGEDLKMDAKTLQERGIGKKASHEISHCIQRLWKIPKETKVFSDPIHGHIEIPPLLIRIIDTPEFQRLRNIKQLGGKYMVFPGAAHNRFEHSLGVAYLAGELLRILKEKQPELDISKRDILCVQIASLCHDLGHGPFSHLYDGVFIKMLNEKGHDITWKHEEASDDMLRHLIKKNHLQGVLKLNGLQDLKNDLDFIASLIHGKPIEKEKDFLYQIVSNNLSGIDVDKWDYFARDSYHLGIGTSFDHKRLLKFIRVCTAEDNKRHICFKEKEAGNLYNMFYTRHLLHKRAYQHPVCNLIEYMIAEALVAADEIFLIQGGQNECKLSEAMKDMEVYAKLTDSVLDQILLCDKPGLEKAKKIIQRITCRELYHYIGESPPCHPDAISKDKLVEMFQRSNSEIPKEDIVVDVVKLDYGRKNEDPLQNVYYYNKKDPDRPFKLEKDEVCLLLPDTFGQRIFRVYSKKRDTVETLQKSWKKLQEEIDWKSKQALAENTPGKPGKRNRDTQTVKSAKKCKRDLNKAF